MMSKICTGCFENKPLTEFYISYVKKGVKYYRSECNKCKTTNNQQVKALSRALKKPEEYMECDHCDMVFFKYTETWNRTKIRSRCPYCNDYNIINFENSILTSEG